MNRLTQDHQGPGIESTYVFDVFDIRGICVEVWDLFVFLSRLLLWTSGDFLMHVAQSFFPPINAIIYE